ncbi:UNVERIFIED_CONTAM: Omega-amidase, chloroplastic [Sesamum radiatum]|uniref:Omega-amidase, chloroplastic n=1 Tax=Sesamum radiatum TaxID=300843 RepID=A0AAW2L9Q1_SESRA
MNPTAAVEMLSSPLLQLHTLHSSTSSSSPQISFPSLFSFRNLDSRRVSDYRRIVGGSSPATPIRSISSATMGFELKPQEARVPPAIPPPALLSARQFLLTFHAWDIMGLIPRNGRVFMVLCSNKEQNIAHARQVIEAAARNGAQLILLPEIWNSPYSNDSFPVYAEDIDAGGDASPSTAMLSELSRSLKITIVGGSIPERSGNKLYNSCCVFGTDGKLKAKHRKLYVATCSPARDSGSSYVAWGHSTLVGPFGEVLATTEHDEATVIAEIDYSLLEQRRKYLPFQRQRRGDLYQLVDVQRLNSTETS